MNRAILFTGLRTYFLNGSQHNVQQSRNINVSSLLNMRRVSNKSVKEEQIDDPKDRSRIIPVELSMKYMESAAFKEAYGDKKIWEYWRTNNLRHSRIHNNTRLRCIKYGRLVTSSPCPICRDEYLVVDYKNVLLLKQFLSDYNGRMVERKKSGVCGDQYLKLRVAIEQAKNHGYLEEDPVFVAYDYDKYRP